MNTTTIKALAALALLSPLAPAQIIVGDGADLQAEIDAAPSGSVIEIHSDQTFPGPLSFPASPAKDISLVAGDGYAPVIDGGFGPAIEIEPSDKVTRFKGLTITATPSWWSVRMVAPPMPAGEVQGLVLDDCVLDSGVYVVHTGDGRVELTVRDSSITNYSLSLSSYDGELDVLVRDSVVEDLLLYDHGAGDELVTLEDSTITDRIHAYGNLGPTVLELLRCRVEGTTWLSENTGAVAPSLLLRAESTLFVGTTASASASGIRIDDHAGAGSLDLELTGCTVTDFDTGIELPPFTVFQGAITLRNTLLASNDQDLTGTLAAATVETCMAEDKLLGVDSILAPAQLDADLALVPGSLGTDAGTSAGLTLSPKDLNGNPRIVDVDCDGTAEINIGAVEAPPSLLATKDTHGGGNPAGTQTSLARVGDTLSIQIDLGPAGLVGLAAVGAPLLVPAPVPGWNGSLLVDPFTAKTFPTPSGLLAFPVPLDLAYVGLPISIQGARAELVGGAVQIQLLDRVDLLLGY